MLYNNIYDNVHKFIDAPVRKTTDEKQCGRKVFEL